MNVKFVFTAIGLMLMTLPVTSCKKEQKLETPVKKEYREIKHTTPNIGQGTNEIKGVVLHHTACRNLKNALSKLTTTGTDVSCHVLIDRDGTRYVLAPPTAITWHAGRSYLANRENANRFTIGIEFQGNTVWSPLTDDQINSAIDYLLPLINKYHIDIDNIVSHKQVRDAWIEKHPNTKTPTKADLSNHEYRRFIKRLLKAMSSCEKKFSKTVLYLQPYGDFTQAEAEEMKDELNQHFMELLNEKITIKVLSKENLLPSYKNKSKTRYRASKILDALKSQTNRGTVIMALTHKDISTTVHGVADYGIMGLAYRGRNVCVISSYRVKDRSQLWKVAVHEFGHAYYNLSHCASGKYTCIMQDAKGGNPLKREKGFCPACKNVMPH